MLVVVETLPARSPVVSALELDEHVSIVLEVSLLEAVVDDVVVVENEPHLPTEHTRIDYYNEQMKWLLDIVFARHQREILDRC